MWAATAGPVFRQANQASATSSSGVTIQCSASLFVVILIRCGSSPKSWRLSGYSSGQPWWVHMSPARWASIPTTTHTVRTGIRPGVVRATSQPCHVTTAAAAIPAASPRCPPTRSARKADANSSASTNAAGTMCHGSRRCPSTPNWPGPSAAAARALICQRPAASVPTVISAIPSRLCVPLR
ncbi:MAG TPA: hypothetical protein VF070_34940 [Streptosporangiaceae bacterium]